MKILVTTDGSVCAQQAIDFIKLRPWLNDDHFIVLMVVEPIPREFGIGSVPETVLTYEQSMYDEAAQIVANSAKQLLEGGVHSAEAKVLTGTIASSVCKFAEENEIDLIVMGSHGRSGFKHFLLGSVAEEVLKKSSCAVQIIKNLDVPAEDKKSDKTAIV
jgi:nucleotide-binding universal stress UspA family protein